MSPKHLFLGLGKRTVKFMDKNTSIQISSSYPEAFLLVSFDVAVQVFESAGEAAVNQILSHMFVCPLHCRPHGDLCPCKKQVNIVIQSYTVRFPN